MATFHRHAQHWLFAAGVSLILAACGGPGGGSSGTVSAGTTKTVTLNGAQENPSITTAATGAWVVPEGATLTPAQVASFKAGNLYVNVHTTANPNGEIRGQVSLPAKCTTLSGAQEVPPNTSTASGTGCLTVNPFTKATAGRIETRGIEGTLAHAHQGPVGSISPVAIPMTQNSPGAWTTAANALMTDAQLVAFITGNMYLNVHSAALPVGEIRGQLINGQ